MVVQRSEDGQHFNSLIAQLPSEDAAIDYLPIELTPGYYYVFVVDMEGKMVAQKEFYASAVNGSLSMGIALPAGIYGVSVMRTDGVVVGDKGQQVVVR